MDEVKYVERDLSNYLVFTINQYKNRFNFLKRKKYTV